MTNPSADTQHDVTITGVTTAPRARFFARAFERLRTHARLSSLLALALLAPLGMGARGCERAVVGADCGKNGGPACACEYNGQGYLAGDSFRDADGCNQCSCEKDGSVPCTKKACVSDGGVSGDGGAGGGSGKTCGGLQGAACARGEYCNFPPDAQCGAADQTGKCAVIPDVCNDLFSPVCGCDGKTYPNACNAAGAGVSVAIKGECSSGSGDAGDGGCNYDGKHYAIGDGFPSSDGCNTCSCKGANQVICTLRACVPSPGTSCGGLQGGACAKDEYCLFQPEAQCGAADQTGTCTAIPTACTKEYVPVCGCDDKTYGNACEAAAAGVSVISKGECGGGATDAGMGGGVCTYNGKQYAAGDSFPDADGCNHCTCAKDGNIACTLIACAPGATCGGLLGLGCNAGEYCDFPIATMCGSGDQSGNCTKVPEVCDTLYAPVCGCDNKTYANSCNAAAASQSVVADGACK